MGRADESIQVIRECDGEYLNSFTASGKHTVKRVFSSAKFQQNISTFSRFILVSRDIVENIV